MTGADELVTVLDGNTFVVSDRRGDVEASPTDPTGLFSFDTRFLSRWVLTIDGQRLSSLSVDDLQYFETRFFLVPGTGTVYVDAKLSVIRRRSVGGGFHERLTLLNHDAEPVDVAVRIEAASDFADLFEVKDALEKQGSYTTDTDDDGVLRLGYRRGTYERTTAISASAPAELDESGLTLHAHVEPHGEWQTEIDVAIASPAAGGAPPRARAARQRDLDRWLAGAPRVECDWEVRGARLAREIWGDPALADQLEREAAQLKRRFNRDFWLADEGWFALALDADWPFDNSFIAWGLRRYGFKREAAQIARGILDAAAFFDGRLPEAFGGYEREATKYPVQYPTACSPQAWSTGAPLLLLRTMLGLEPLGDHLVVDPALPAGIGVVALLDVPGRWGRIDAFARGQATPRR